MPVCFYCEFGGGLLWRSGIIRNGLSLLGGGNTRVCPARRMCPKPVQICYGTADPWTPGPRVEALLRFEAVQHVDALEGIGHCPHDEAPELVHPLLFDFLNQLSTDSKASMQNHTLEMAFQ